MSEKNPSKALIERAEHLIKEMELQEIPFIEEITKDQVHELIHDPLGSKSPVQLNLSNPEFYRQIPIFNLVQYLGRLIQQQGEMKLTPKGALPLKVVYELYSQGFISENIVDLHLKFKKQIKEQNSVSIYLTHRLAIMTGLCKKRKNRLSLTKKGEKFLQNDHLLAVQLVDTFATRFNWATMDNCDDEYLSQRFFGYTLMLLYKYGTITRDINFYIDKYLDSIHDNLVVFDSFEYAGDIYRYRTFEIFLKHLGVIDYDSRFIRINELKVNELFDQVFRIRLYS
jgi:hypothetical protein